MIAGVCVANADSSLKNQALALVFQNAGCLKDTAATVGGVVWLESAIVCCLIASASCRISAFESDILALLMAVK